MRKTNGHFVPGKQYPVLDDVYGGVAGGGGVCECVGIVYRF